MDNRRSLISSIRFGFYASKRMTAAGRHELAAHFRNACRRQVASLRAARGGA